MKHKIYKKKATFKKLRNLCLSLLRKAKKNNYKNPNRKSKYRLTLKELLHSKKMRGWSQKIMNKHMYLINILSALFQVLYTSFYCYKLFLRLSMKVFEGLYRKALWPTKALWATMTQYEPLWPTKTLLWATMSNHEPLISTVYRTRNHLLHSHIIKSYKTSQWFKSCSQMGAWVIRPLDPGPHIRFWAPGPHKILISVNWI